MTSSPMQRILVAHRYYWPDTPPYASILRKIVQKWSQEGHQVDVLSSQPSYKQNVELDKRPVRDQIDQSTVWRLSLPNEAGRPFIRLMNALRLCIALFFKVLVGRYDVVMISTVPPILGGFAAALAAKLSKTRFIYHCMDIHPEVGRISGEFSNPFVFSALLKLDRWVCRQADPVIVLSEDMKNTLHQRADGDDVNVQVLNNFSVPSSEKIPDTLPFEITPNKITILFAGNVGRFQGLETAVEAMAKLRDRNDIELVIMGEGTAKAPLMEQVEQSQANVRFVGHHPVETAKAAMRKADIGLVSLRPGIYRYAYPSKTLTYLEQSCPLLVVVEPESKLACEVTDENLGYSVPNGDPQALATTIVELASHREDVYQMRSSARKKSEEDCAPDLVLQHWSTLLSQRSQ